MYVFKDSIINFYYSVVPPNTIEIGATSTGHTIKISDKVHLDRTSAKSDVLIIEGNTSEMYHGYFNKLNFDSSYALLLEENTNEYYSINLQTLTVKKYSYDDYSKIENKDAKFEILKKHYDFPWKT